MKPNLVLLLFTLFPYLCFGANYYVSPTGNDAGPGTSLAEPFKTIGAAATIMQPGDTCYIRAGTYRETITPAHSGEPGAPITFMPYNGETVTIHAADEVTGWRLTAPGDAVEGASIYVAPMNWDLGAGFNQIYVDGTTAVEARYPNFGANPDWLNPAMTGGSLSKPADDFIMNVNGANRPDDYWVGGVAMGIFGSQWWATGGVVTASSGTQLILGDPDKRNSKYSDNTSGGGSAFISGIVGELDRAGEWGLKDGMLYLWAPDSSDPSTLTVEAKARKWCVDLSGRNHIHIKDLNMVGGSINMQCDYSVVEGVTMKYPSHFTYYTWGNNSGGSRNTGDNGVNIFGDYNIFRNSVITDSSGNGLIVGGSNNLIIRNQILRCNFSGSTSSNLVIRESKGNNRILLNTIRHAGRDVVRIQSSKNAAPDYLMYNRIADAGYICKDLGIVYYWGVEGGNTEIAYNWVHNNRRDFPAIYNDNFCKDWLIYRNVTWDCGAGVRMNTPHVNLQVYNNTLFNSLDVGSRTYRAPESIAPQWWTDGGYGGTTTSSRKNNLFLSDSPESQLTDYENEDFSLKVGAAAINSGEEIAGVTDAVTDGSPDEGAYEAGEHYWVPGHAGYSYKALGLVANATDGAVLLTWDQNLEPEFASYNIYRSATSGGPWTLIDSGITTNSYVDRSAVLGTRYYYKVDFVDDTATAFESGEEVSGIPVLDISVDSAYEEITLRGIMDAVPGTVSYSVSRALASDGVFSEIATGRTTNRFTDRSVSNDVAYLYRVSLVDAQSSTTESQVIGPLSVTVSIISEDYEGSAPYQFSSPSKLSLEAGVADPAGGGNHVLRVFDATKEWSSVQTSPSNDELAARIQPGWVFTFTADVYIPAATTFASDDQINLITQWNDGNNIKGESVDLRTDTGPLNPLRDEWYTISFSGTIPDTEADGDPITHVQAMIQWRDKGADAAAGTIGYMDNVSLTAVPPDTDTDDDGIDDNWEELHFPGNLTTVDATSDFDRDGTSDYVEFKAGTDPNDPSSRFTTDIMEMRPQTNEMDISWPAADGRSYSIWYSENLVDWFLLQSGIVATPPSNSLTIGTDPEDTKMFFRIEID